MTKINLAALRAKLKELKDGQKRPSADFFKKFLMIGEFNHNYPDRSVIRILPPNDDEGSFYVETLLHKINGKNIHCPRFKKQSCPICEYVRSLWQTNDTANIDKARQIKAKKKFYFNVISRERVVPDEKTGEDVVQNNAGPLIWSCGVKVFEKILKSMIDEECGDLTDLKDGFDFRVIMEIKEGYPNYDDSKPKRNPSPAGTDDEIKIWMDSLHNLSDLISYKAYEELNKEVKIFQGLSASESVDSGNSVTTRASEPLVVKESPKQNDDSDKDEFLEQLKRLQQDSDDD